MKPAILVLRIISSMLLIGVVVTVTITDSGAYYHIGALSGMFNIAVVHESSSIYLSSALIGFVLSLLTTIMAIKYVGIINIYLFSLILAALGSAGYINEIWRIYHNHIQILLSFPLLLVISDWISVHHMLKKLKCEKK